jgi:hypothetical protein
MDRSVAWFYFLVFTGWQRQFDLGMPLGSGARIDPTCRQGETAPWT